MANMYSYHKRYMGNQAVCQPTYTSTETTGDSNPCHFYPKHYKICIQHRQKIYEIIDALQRSNEYLNRLFSIRGSDTMH